LAQGDALRHRGEATPSCSAHGSRRGLPRQWWKGVLHRARSGVPGGPLQRVGQLLDELHPRSSRWPSPGRWTMRRRRPARASRRTAISRVGGCGCKSQELGRWTMRRRRSARASRRTANSRVGGCGCKSQGRGCVGTQVGRWARFVLSNKVLRAPTLSFLVSQTEHLEISRFKTGLSISGGIQLSSKYVGPENFSAGHT
jgi:hypothetical protein